MAVGHKTISSYVINLSILHEILTCFRCAYIMGFWPQDHQYLLYKPKYIPWNMDTFSLCLYHGFLVDSSGVIASILQGWLETTGANIKLPFHYDDVIMSTIASLITSLTIVYSIVYSDADRRKHQSAASLAFVWGIHRGPVNSPHKLPVTRKMFPFDDVIMLPVK